MRYPQALLFFASASLFPLLSLCLLPGCRPSGSTVVSFDGPIMGTHYIVKLPRLPIGVELSTVKAAV